MRSQVNDRSTTFTKFYKEAEPPEHLDPGEMADFRSQMYKVKTVSKRCAMTKDIYQANDLSANVGISLEYVDQGGLLRCIAYILGNSCILFFLLHVVDKLLSPICTTVKAMYVCLSFSFLLHSLPLSILPTLSN